MRTQWLTTRPQSRVLAAVAAVGIAAAASYAILRAATPTASAYAEAISYTQTRPSFTPTRTVDVSNASELRSAISHLQAGELVKATAGFTVPGQTIIQSRLRAPAVIDLSGHSVRFVYTGGSNYSAVWLKDPKNVWIYGGATSTADTGGACIKANGADSVRWWGFAAHDCGGSGFSALTTAPLTHDDFEGEIWKVGQNLAWDPHKEKGTGLHGAILWDANTSYPFSDNRFAFDAHDIPTGACVELGNDQPSSPAGGNVLYERCVNESEVARSQTGGNGLQLWGDTSSLGVDIKFLAVDNAQGRALDAQGMYPGQSLSGITVAYGRATKTNLNSSLNEPKNGLPWDWRGAVVYENIRPPR